MVVQKTINNLKERPKDERKVVAGGIAITVVVVLLLGWAVMFFKRIQSGSQKVNLDSGAQDQFNFTTTKQAQQAIQQQAQNPDQGDLYQLRNDAAANQVGTQQQMDVQQIGTQKDAFGNTTTY